MRASREVTLFDKLRMSAGHLQKGCFVKYDTAQALGKWQEAVSLEGSHWRQLLLSVKRQSK